jgi:hypothetical protein
MKSSPKTKAEPDLKTVLAELRELRKEVRAPARRLLTVDEAAHYLGLAPKTIRNGLGPRAAKPFPVRPVKVGGRVLFDKKSLEEFCDSLAGAE